jgi:hypothetical protein
MIKISRTRDTSSIKTPSPSNTLFRNGLPSDDSPKMSRNRRKQQESQSSLEDEDMSPASKDRHHKTIKKIQVLGVNYKEDSST